MQQVPIVVDAARFVVFGDGQVGAQVAPTILDPFNVEGDIGDDEPHAPAEAQRLNCRRHQLLDGVQLSAHAPPAESRLPGSRVVAMETSDPARENRPRGSEWRT